jgi:hypothetical protein
VDNQRLLIEVNKGAVDTDLLAADLRFNRRERRERREIATKRHENFNHGWTRIFQGKRMEAKK